MGTTRASDTPDNVPSVTNTDDTLSPDDQENTVSSESEAPVSERAASGHIDSPLIGGPRVQFEKIQEEDDQSPQTEEALTEEDRKLRRHKHDHK